LNITLNLRIGLPESLVT